MLEELSDRSLKFEVISGVKHPIVSLCYVKFLDFVFVEIYLLILKYCQVLFRAVLVYFHIK